MKSIEVCFQGKKKSVFLSIDASGAPKNLTLKYDGFRRSPLKRLKLNVFVALCAYFRLKYVGRFVVCCYYTKIRNCNESPKKISNNKQRAGIFIYLYSRLFKIKGKNKNNCVNMISLN